MILDKIYYKVLSHNSSVCDFNFVIDYTNINIKTLKKILNNFTYLLNKYGVYNSSVMSQFLFDIEDALEKVEFTDVQKERMAMWFDGFTENEIGDKYGIARQVVSKSIHAACRKIHTYLVNKS